MSILSEADVQRITQEERIRLEIRAALAPAKPTGLPHRVWDGLNSNFGLWFLTAFFITGLGSFASKWYEGAREKEQKQEAALAEELKNREALDEAEMRRKEIYERVTLEISYRYSITLAGLKDASTRLGRSMDKNAHNAIVYAIQPLTKPASSAQAPLFKEYESYSGLALIAELRRHAGQGEANMLKIILARTSSLLHEISFDKTGKSYSAKSAAIELVERMQNPNWNNGFAYTDCSVEDPFC